MPPARNSPCPAAHPPANLPPPLPNDPASRRTRHPATNRPLLFARRGGPDIGIRSIRKRAYRLADEPRRAGSGAGDSVWDWVDGVCQRRSDAKLAQRRFLLRNQHHKNTNNYTRETRIPVVVVRQDQTQLWPHLPHRQTHNQHHSARTRPRKHVPR